LLEGGAQVWRVGLGNAPLLAMRLQLSGQFLDGPGENCGFCFRLRQGGFELGQTALGFAQFALQRQRSFAGWLAAGHRGVVETLALGVRK